MTVPPTEPALVSAWMQAEKAFTSVTNTVQTAACTLRTTPLMRNIETELNLCLDSRRPFGKGCRRAN